MRLEFRRLDFGLELILSLLLGLSLYVDLGLNLGFRFTSCFFFFRLENTRSFLKTSTRLLFSIAPAWLINKI